MQSITQFQSSNVTAVTLEVTALLHIWIIIIIITMINCSCSFYLRMSFKIVITNEFQKIIRITYRYENYPEIMSDFISRI